MKIKEIGNLLDAACLTGEAHLDSEVISACCSDMMSDVLAYVKDQGVLITGLINPQVIRTANMMDMICIVFVRGKKPTEEMVELARECGVTVMCTDKRAFEASGILYAAGLSRSAEGKNV
jgi:predicted transcriptional regulator